MKGSTGLIWAAIAMAMVAGGGCDRTEPSAASGQSSGPSAERGMETAKRQSGDASRPNIVLIVPCTFRYSHMSVAGYPRPTTPFLDSLATGGVLFENAVSASSWTKPSVASILSGLTPNVHDLTDMYGDKDIISEHFSPARILSDGVMTLAESVRAVGYATAARINNVQGGEFFNLCQGFDDAVTSHEMNTVGMVNDLAKWLRGLKEGQPFLFFMLTRDAHIPYEPEYERYLAFNRSDKVIEREEYAGYCRWLRGLVERRMKDKRVVPPELREQWVDLYDAELAQLDRALSRIPAVLEEAGRRENTLIVVIADHGERFFEHGKIGHGNVPDECVAHVPLILNGLNVPAGKRVRAVVRSIDVYPTLIELTGAEAPDLVQGTSLLPLVYGDPRDADKLTAFSSYMNVHHTLRDERFTLHLWGAGRRTMHDREADPAELRDIIDERPEVASRLESELSGWLEQEEALRPLVAGGGTRELTPEVIEQLRSLGYIR